MLRPIAVAFAAAAILGVIFSGGFLAVQHLSGNFHEVVAGELYRSGQLSADRLARYVRDRGIRTIVNLRGANAGKPWYDAEVLAASQLGVTHVDFAMSAKHELSQPRAAQLISLLTDARKPILIHCEGGADRTGLVAAIYMAAIAKSGESAAEHQMSLGFGHMSIPFVRSYAMNRSFESLEPSFGYVD